MPVRFPDRDASSFTGFAGNRLDRVSEMRADAAYLQTLRGRDDRLLVLFADDRPLLRVRSEALELRHPPEIAASLGAAVEEAVLLGLEDGVPLFAAVVEAPPDTFQAQSDIKLIDLRSLANQDILSPHALGVLAQARSMTHWHARHRFCANCGAPTTIALGGYRRDCAACGAHHFPRTDPVVIMLAIDAARDRCVLGRQYRFLPGMYSCLAGFVEPGETLEDAVRREIREEAGIAVGKVAYLASQPWPFPASLMIGCFAEALDFGLVREVAELEDVRWFTRAELAAMLERRHPDGLTAPLPLAIAHHIIKAYVES
jgi:NAD+ diphosphatase